jgi:hypothetical protein
MREIPDPAHTECTSCAHHRKREGEIYCHRRAPMMAGDGTARWPRVTEIASDGCSEYVEYAANPFCVITGSQIERIAKETDGEQLNRTFY